MKFFVQVDRIQIDSQVPDQVFSTVFAPKPLPKSVARSGIPPPIVELSFIMRQAEHSNISQIKWVHF